MSAGSRLTPMRRTSVLFALVALGLCTTALALLATAGTALSEVLADPDAHEPFLVFFVPGVFAGVCASLLWRRGGSARATCIALLPLCVLVVAVLAGREWLIVAMVFATPTTALAITRTQLGMPGEA